MAKTDKIVKLYVLQYNEDGTFRREVYYIPSTPHRMPLGPQ